MIFVHGTRVTGFRLFQVCQIAIAVVLAPAHMSGQENLWSPRGVGGGGSLFAPSINPANNDEFYVGCDMSGLFHTTDFGLSYSITNFRQIQGGQNSNVKFTIDPAVRYCVNSANDLSIPVKSNDGGATWKRLPGIYEGSLFAGKRVRELDAKDERNYPGDRFSYVCRNVPE